MLVRGIELEEAQCVTNYFLLYIINLPLIHRRALVALIKMSKARPGTVEVAVIEEKRTSLTAEDPTMACGASSVHACGAVPHSIRHPTIENIDLQELRLPSSPFTFTTQHFGTRAWLTPEQNTIFVMLKRRIASPS